MLLVCLCVCGGDRLCLYLIFFVCLCVCGGVGEGSRLAAVGHPRSSRWGLIKLVTRLLQSRHQVLASRISFDVFSDRRSHRKPQKPVG